MFATKTIVSAVLIALPFVASAGTRDPGVNQRQHNQQSRIQQGVKSGELTAGETRRLEGEQRHIRREEARYKSDGQLTRAERADLQHDQNRASRDIYRQKHDDQRRPPAAVRDPGVNARQHNQQDRIAQGVRSGELTKGEAQGLRVEQRSIRQEERQYKSDGQLTRAERADLQQDLNRSSRNIYSEKHDDQSRPPAAVRDPGVNARQHNQQDRIAQGVRSGELTKGEAQGLRVEQRSIRQEERQYKSDGMLTTAERKDLQQDLNASSRNIYDEKHDGEKRN